MTESTDRIEFEEFYRDINGELVLFTPLFHQDYANAYIQAGVTDHDMDTIFLLMVRGEDETLLILRPDEAQTIVWTLSGVIHSLIMAMVEEEFNEKKEQETSQ